MARKIKGAFSEAIVKEVAKKINIEVGEVTTYALVEYYPTAGPKIGSTLIRTGYLRGLRETLARIRDVQLILDDGPGINVDDVWIYSDRIYAVVVL